HAGLRFVRADGLEMASASAPSSRPSEALADVPAEPSRGHCRDGLLHRTHAYFRHSLLLFHHRPRPSSNPSPPRNAYSQRALGCPATARNVGIQPGAAALPDLRPRLEVQCRCGLNREGNRLPASAHRIPQSLAEWNCRALGWECAAGLARSCDRAESETSETVAE